MAGHSKWKQIKYKKAVSDAKRGKIFSKLSRALTVATHEKGADSKTNSKLASLIEEARAVNMPSDNIERAIKKASDKDSGALKEVLYEAYGPSGSALIITAVTDNSNRTTNEIKHLLSEHNGKMGEHGSAMWAFDKRDGEYVPRFPLALTPKDNQKLEELMGILDDHDDVQDVYSNVE